MPGPLKAALFLFLPPSSAAWHRVWGWGHKDTCGSRTAVCWRPCRVTLWVRTQRWAGRAVLSQPSGASRRAPAPPGGEAGATGRPCCCSERELPRGHRTKQEAGGAQQPRSVGLFCEPHPGGHDCRGFFSESHWYHERHKGKTSQRGIQIWGS